MRVYFRLLAVSIVVPLFVVPISAFSEPAKPLPPTVVSATRLEVPSEEIGRALDVRTREDIAAEESSSLTDSLQTVPGVRLQNLGGLGSPGTTLIEIRGFRSSGTQLLFNGLRFNDPSSISGIADSYFSYLTVNDLRAVEVLKGANSTLYGSDGQAGSVNLLSEEPIEGTGGELTLRGGSFTTFEEVVKLNGGTKNAGLFATVTRMDSEGLSENGNYENTTVSLVGKAKLNEEFSITPLFRMVSAQNDLDSSPTLDQSGNFITNLPTASNQAKVQGYFYGLTTDYKPCDTFDSKLSLYSNQTDRSYFFDFGGGFSSLSDFEGASYNLDWQNALTLDELNSVVLAGFEYEHQTYDTDSGGLKDDGRQDRYAIFLKERFNAIDKILRLDGGVRITHVSAIDRTIPSFEISALLTVPTIESRIHSSFSQGFRAPSLFELGGKIIDETDGHLVTVGNKGLKAEETLSFDAGISQPIVEDKLSADITFFNLASDDTIVFDFPNETHFNGKGGENQGIESSITATPVDWLKLRGAYTYLAKADVDGNRLQRRPYNVFAISSLVKAGIADWYSELRYRSGEDISFFGFTDRFKEGDYTVFDMVVTLPVTEEWQLFARGNNLFDTDYTDSGYRMPGISLFGGIRLKIGAI